MSGDYRFGYCRIPNTQGFYAWGECEYGCLDGPYPGIHIIMVSEADNTLFRDVVDRRDDSMEERAKGFTMGGILWRCRDRTRCTRGDCRVRSERIVELRDRL